MSATPMVHVRVDETLKAQASEALAAMGLTISDAVRVFLTRVAADRELPFALQAPNASSRTESANAKRPLIAMQFCITVRASG